jgi:acetyl-CoA acetyltransferase
LFWYVSDPIDSYRLSALLGLHPKWQLTINGGSYNAAGMAGVAMAAIAAGQCSRVLCLHVVKTSSRKPGGRPGFPFRAPYGATFAPVQFALPAMRHMHEYGTTQEQFGAVAMACRAHAMLNPKAVRRTPLTLDGYLAGRVIASPFRRDDCCLRTDGGTAFIVGELSTGNRDYNAEIIAASVNASGPLADRGRDADEYTSMGARRVGEALFAQSGLAPSDIDFLQLYDAFTAMVIVQLEDLGFCRKGEGGPFVEAGRIGPGGALPVNTAGGHLSEAYTHGMSLVVEAVRQLRGDYENGPRHVAGAEVGLVATGPTPASGLLLARSAA